MGRGEENGDFGNKCTRTVECTTLTFKAIFLANSDTHNLGLLGFCSKKHLCLTLILLTKVVLHRETVIGLGKRVRGKIDEKGLLIFDSEMSPQIKVLG